MGVWRTMFWRTYDNITENKKSKRCLHDIFLIFYPVSGRFIFIDPIFLKKENMGQVLFVFVTLTCSSSKLSSSLSESSMSGDAIRSEFNAFILYDLFDEFIWPCWLDGISLISSVSNTSPHSKNFCLFYCFKDFCAGIVWKVKMYI